MGQLDICAEESNENLQSVQSQVQEILALPENAELVSALVEFSNILLAYGIKVRPYNDGSVLKLSEITFQKKCEIAKHYRLWTSWIAPEAGERLPLVIDAKRERTVAEKALEYFDLEVSEDFWKTVKPDHLLEIYGHDMIQIYRNLKFFDYCGYSLLEISVFEWFHLWERPSSTMKEIFSYVDRVMGSVIPVMNFKVKTHVLRERRSSGGLTEGFVPRACLVNFEFIGTVQKENQPGPAGFICTASADNIAVGDEALAIEFV